MLDMCISGVVTPIQYSTTHYQAHTVHFRDEMHATPGSEAAMMAMATKNAKKYTFHTCPKMF
jgi:hypothetical protein